MAGRPSAACELTGRRIKTTGASFGGVSAGRTQARALEELNDQSADGYVSPFHLAAIHLAQEEKEKSLRRSREARREGSRYFVISFPERG